MDHELDYDYNAAIKRQELSLDDIKSLRISPPTNMPKEITDKHLALFLNACDKNLKVTRQVIETYYAARKNAPEHFTDRDPNSASVQQCLQNLYYFYLPVTPNGYQLVFHCLNNPRALSYHFDPAIKTFFMTIDMCLNAHGPRPGIIFLFDMRKMSLFHLTRARISGIRKFFHYLQEGLPAKLYNIHVFNVVSFFDKVMMLIRPFMKAEILNNMILHPSSLDYDEFSEKYNIPKSCLPAEYGGTLGTVEELHAQFTEEILQKSPYFIAEEKLRNDRVK